MTRNEAKELIIKIGQECRNSLTCTKCAFYDIDTDGNGCIIGLMTDESMDCRTPEDVLRVVKLEEE